MTATDTDTGTKGRRRRGKAVEEPIEEIAVETVSSEDGADGENTAATEADIESAEADSETKDRLEKEAADVVRLEEITGEIADAMFDIAEVTKKGASETRNKWINLGNHLIEVREMFEVTILTNDGELKTNISNKRYAAALEKSGINKLCPVPNNRTDSIWLAEMYDNRPELYAMVEEISEAFENKSFGHPKSIRRWYRDEVKFAIECAVSQDVTADKDAFSETMEALADAVSSSNATPKEIRALTFLEAAHDDDFTEQYAKYKPKAETIPFKEGTIKVAAARLVKLLVTHPDPVGVAALIPELLEARMTEIAEEEQKKDDAIAAKKAEKDEKKAAKEAGDALSPGAIRNLEAILTSSEDDTDDVSDDDGEEGFPED